MRDVVIILRLKRFDIYASSLIYIDDDSDDIDSNKHNHLLRPQNKEGFQT